MILTIFMALNALEASKPALYKQKKKTPTSSAKSVDKTATVKKYLPFESSKSLQKKKKKQKETERKEQKAIYNDIKEYYGNGDDDEEEYREQRTSSVIGSDFAEMGGDIKAVMQKHHFTLGETPYSVQGLPIIYTSKSTGFNLGAIISLTNLKYEDPYTYKFTLQYWASDRGAKKHEISLDIPHFFSTNWHARIAYTYPVVITQRYYGVGNETTNNTAFIDPSSPSFISRTYYQYKLTYPRFSFDLEYRIPRQDFSIYAGLALDKASIDPHNRDARSKIYTEQPYGYGGGNTNYVKGGIKYDTRDYPFNPTRGITIALTYTNHGKFIKSDFPHSNINLAYMGFFSFWRYFTFSQRLMIDQMWGNLPFFALSEFKSYNDYGGLGGSDFLRGAPSYRYIDNLKLANQFELRTRIYNGKIFSQRLMIHFNPFWDMGRVWDRKKKFSFNNFHHSVGNEFRFTWNENFITSFTMGKSGDGFATYLTFGENFI